MSSYTEVIFFEDFTEGFKKRPEDKFTSKINKFEEGIAFSGKFSEPTVKDPLHMYVGSFKAIDWNAFCEQVKLYQWANIGPSYFMIQPESDPNMFWYVLSVQDIITDQWKSRPELKFLT